MDFHPHKWTQGAVFSADDVKVAKPSGCCRMELISGIKESGHQGIKEYLLVHGRCDMRSIRTGRTKLK